MTFFKFPKIETVYKRSMEGVVCSPEVEMKDSNGERVIVKIKGRDFVPGFDKILKQYKVL